MRHIQEKNDWFYEFRPQIIFFFGLLGLASKLYMAGSSSFLLTLSQVCGLFLLGMSVKIMDWRKAYRATARKIRF
jgi:hypothetical protein